MEKLRGEQLRQQSVYVSAETLYFCIVIIAHASTCSDHQMQSAIGLGYVKLLQLNPDDMHFFCRNVFHIPNSQLQFLHLFPEEHTLGQHLPVTLLSTLTFHPQYQSLSHQSLLHLMHHLTSLDTIFNISTINLTSSMEILNRNK